MNIATFITHDSVSPWHFKQRHADIIASIIPETTVTICQTEEEFVNALPSTHVALAWTFKQEWFQVAPNLRVLSTPAAGKDYFHVTPPDCVAMLNGHFHGEIIGETVVGMILGIIRGILPNVTNYKELPWARPELTPGLRPLRNANITILGFGNIGRWIGKLLKPFGTHIRGLVRNTNAQLPDWFTQGDCIFSIDQLDEFLKDTDHLVLALPSTTGTDKLLNAERIVLLPRHATVINIGRGNAIDEPALIHSLENNRLLGACLDVFATEPLLADDPVRTCPNLWTLPHASAISENYLDLYASEIAHDLLKLKLETTP